MNHCLLDCLLLVLVGFGCCWAYSAICVYHMMRKSLIVAGLQNLLSRHAVELVTSLSYTQSQQEASHQADQVAHQWLQENGLVVSTA